MLLQTSLHHCTVFSKCLGLLVSPHLRLADIEAMLSWRLVYNEGRGIIYFMCTLLSTIVTCKYYYKQVASSINRRRWLRLTVNQVSVAVIVNAECLHARCWEFKPRWWLFNTQRIHKEHLIQQILYLTLLPLTSVTKLPEGGGVFITV